MGDSLFRYNIIYFTPPNLSNAGRRYERYSQYTACGNCGGHLQTYCDECGEMYAAFPEAMYECGNCETPKNLYCPECHYPQTL